MHGDTAPKYKIQSQNHAICVVEDVLGDRQRHNLPSVIARLIVIRRLEIIFQIVN